MAHLILNSIKSGLQSEKSGMCDGILTDITEQHREEDEAVRRPQQHYGQIHPKIKDLEDL